MYICIRKENFKVSQANCSKLVVKNTFYFLVIQLIGYVSIVPYIKSMYFKVYFAAVFVLISHG